MEGIVYKVTNIKDDKVYIGITTNSIESRKLDQLKSSNTKQTKFYEAITTYGKDSFTWEQIDTANNIDELAKKETEYILKYNSKEDGFNSDRGAGIKKSIYQYDMQGNMINVFESLEDAGSAVNADKKKISTVCLSVNKNFNNFYWSYEYVEKFVPPIDLRKKIVKQYSLEGKLIDEFSSVSEASKKTGCNKTSIAKVCRGERKKCGNYFWTY